MATVQHIYEGHGAPAPELLVETGTHYVNLDTEDQYLAVAFRDVEGGPITETRWTPLERAPEEGGSYVEGGAWLNVYPRGSSRAHGYTVWQPIDTPHLEFPDLAGYPGAAQITAQDYLLTVSNPANGLILENVTAELVCGATLTPVPDSPGSYQMELPVASVMLQLRRLDAGPWVLLVHSLPGVVTP